MLNCLYHQVEKWPSILNNIQWFIDRYVLIYISLLSTLKTQKENIPEQDVELDLEMRFNFVWHYFMLPQKGKVDKFLIETLIFELGIAIGHPSELNFSFDLTYCSCVFIVDFEQVNAGCLSTSTLMQITNFYLTHQF